VPAAFKDVAQSGPDSYPFKAVIARSRVCQRASILFECCISSWMRVTVDVKMTVDSGTCAAPEEACPIVPAVEN